MDILDTTYLILLTKKKTDKKAGVEFDIEN